MFVVGLTGGIGSGKSEAAKCFSALSIPVIDADVIARELVMPGQPLLERLIDHYGSDFLNQAGKLRRKKLREFIFTNLQEKQWLEDLLHPAIRRVMQKRCDQLRQRSDAPYIVLVIPLLIETLPNPLVDRILLLDCAKETQYQRVRAREPLLEDKQIMAIIHSQVSRATRLAKANDVIENEGNLKALEQKVLQLHAVYCRYNSL